jgi:neutral ceramidase
VADITPPLEVGLLTSSVNGTYAPFESVRLPLKARVLVLKSGTEQVAIVAVDLLTINDTSVFGWDNFKQGMADAVPAKNIIVCCTHTHCAPESVALSGLYLTPVYQNWLKQVQLNIKEAINTASAEAKACNVSVATSKLDGYTMQRRIKTPKGIVMSDAMQPIAPAILNLPPVDRRVTSIHLHDNQGKGIATIVHAICHPVHEMCLPHISSEFPGEMCIELERSAGQGMALFLNGAAGDTNPPTVSMGPEYARKHGQALAKTVQNAEHKLLFDASAFTMASGKTQLSIREGSDMDNELDALARLNAIRLGPLAIVFLPGEPFVETAFEIEKNSPFEHTVVVGYSENNIGYLPTEEAFEQGGYEVGPGKWSFLEKGTDHIIRNKALWLLNELYNN